MTNGTKVIYLMSIISLVWTGGCTTALMSNADFIQETPDPHLPSPADLNGDDNVDMRDLALFFSEYQEHNNILPKVINYPKIIKEMEEGWQKDTDDTLQFILEWLANMDKLREPNEI